MTLVFILAVIVIFQLFAIILLFVVVKNREPLEKVKVAFGMLKGIAIEYEINRDKKVQQLIEEIKELKNALTATNKESKLLLEKAAKETEAAKSETKIAKQEAQAVKGNMMFVLLGVLFIMIFLTITNGAKRTWRSLSHKKPDEEAGVNREELWDGTSSKIW